MSVQEVLAGSGGILLAVMTLLQIAPVKINPWSWIAKAIGRAINADVLRELQTVKTDLADHIRADDARNADLHRARILRFNNELIRDIPHTREEFLEVLQDIDAYEAYCKEHPDYSNGRAVHAVGNISRVYDERLQKRDFL